MRRRRKAEPGAEVDLQSVITPMLDMAFQLLAFFVFTYKPSDLEGQMQLNLPSAGVEKAKTEAEVDPSKISDTDLEVRTELTVIIKGGRDGNESAPSQYLVEGLQGTSQPMTTLQELEKYLLKAKVDLTNRDDVKIRADSRLKYAYVVEVMDVCSHPDKGGFKRVGFAAPPDLEAPKNE